MRPECEVEEVLHDMPGISRHLVQRDGHDVEVPRLVMRIGRLLSNQRADPIQRDQPAGHSREAAETVGHREAQPHRRGETVQVLPVRRALEAGVGTVDVPAVREDPIEVRVSVEKDQQCATAPAENESVEGAESIPRALLLVGDVLLV